MLVPATTKRATANKSFTMLILIISCVIIKLKIFHLDAFTRTGDESVKGAAEISRGL